MVKITKRVVEAAEAQEKDYLIWDDELPGFGLRVFSSGKRSYVIRYRTKGRSRRYTIGLHGAWAPKTARREAKVQLGRVPQHLGLHHRWTDLQVGELEKNTLASDKWRQLATDKVCTEVSMGLAANPGSGSYPACATSTGSTLLLRSRSAPLG